MEMIFSVQFIEELLKATFRMMTPLLLVALGELFSERAGLVNIGLDGIMAVGSLAGYLTLLYSGSPVLGMVAGMLVGVIFNLLFAFNTVTLRSGQIVNGMALNLLAPGLVTFVYRSVIGVGATPPPTVVLDNVNIPWLSELPIIGSSLFGNSPVFYLALFIALLTYIFFRKSKKGLDFAAVGENPRAAESMGVPVIRVKYLACILCGALAGLGGAFLTTAYLSSFTEGMVAGRGFIALSAVIFGGWRVGGIIAATMLFGFADALQMRLLVAVKVIPSQLFAMLPYLFTFFALIFIRDRSAGPKAAGQPYIRESQ